MAKIKEISKKPSNGINKKKNKKKPLENGKENQVRGKKTKPDFSSMSTEGFMADNFTYSDSESEHESAMTPKKEKSPKIAKGPKKTSENSMHGDSEDSSDELNPMSHAQSLAKLKQTDPEFYDFLQENDQKLLNFQVDSDPSDDDEQKEEEVTHEDDDDVHKLDDVNLHEGSDESDFEDSGDVRSDRVITIKMIRAWQKALQSTVKVELLTISTVVKAFHAALLSVCTVESEEESTFKVEGAGVFNAVVQMCVLYLQPALKKILGLQKSNRDPQKCKRWIKVKGMLKSYFIDLFKLLGGVTSTNILNVLLKHLHQMSPFLGCFPILAKTLFKRLISLWSTSEETVRVLAFLCILRVTRNNQPILLETVLKMMYMTYVKSSKFVSPGTWPSIGFMRRSLVEMFALDVNVSYQHVFLYIRQLAIHLRNAIVLHKKENIQAVYNWQFVNSAQLWAELLTLTRSKPQLQSLIYPLVMIITNTIKLIPTAQYFPLRFHCIQILLNLSRDSDIYIPITPFLTETLKVYDFGKKHKKVSMKPMSFSCILRLSKSQLSENGFKDAVIENVYALLLESLSIYSHSISFSDMTVPTVIELKQFLKKCPVPNYCKKIRQILDKVEENGQFIETELKKVSFQLSDIKLIKAWETTIKNNGTPLQKYFDSWNKLNKIQKKKRATKNDDLSEKLPSIKKIKRDKKASKEGPVDLFPSDSEDDNTFENSLSEPAKVTKKLKKKSKTSKLQNIVLEDEPIEKADDVQDFDMSEW